MLSRSLLKRLLLLGLCGMVVVGPEMLLTDSSSVDVVAAQKRRKSAPAKSKLPVEAERMRRGKVAEVDPKTLSEVKASAKKIDQLVAANYKKYKVTPNELTTDEQFLRRAYLDLNGTIPDLLQTRIFLNSKSADKREKLIDSLLEREGYVAHYYNFWADQLRTKDRIGRLRLEPYQAWIKESLRENKPYDQFVKELLTAEGKVWENPAVGYYLTDDGMPLDNMNNTIQIFLGTQIGCAQCHDHPFDRWTQKEFYQIAAFTAQLNTRDYGDSAKEYGKMQKEFRSATDRGSDMVKIGNASARYGIVQNLIVPNRYKVSEVAWKQLKLPETYIYPDGKPGEVVNPKTLFGSEVTVKKGDSRREIFANWLASPDNPRFAKTIVNRLWKQLFGVGQIEPIDDIRDDTVAENPELMAFLEAELIRVKFDIKEFLRIVMNTDVYQRQTATVEYDPAEPYHFAGPILRRMSAEQAWDSLLTLAIPAPEAYSKDYDRSFERVIDVSFTAKPEEVIEQANKLDEEYFGGKARSTKERPYSYIPDRNTYQGKYIRMLLARAYELPAPLPPDHFLRQFGQSDRELIGAASTDGSIPQILTMLNGPSTHMMLEAGSEIYENVVKEKSNRSKINSMFLSILNREPTADEVELAENEIKRAGPRGFGNVIWALVNTREFLFIQ